MNKPVNPNFLLGGPTQEYWARKLHEFSQAWARDQQPQDLTRLQDWENLPEHEQAYYYFIAKAFGSLLQENFCDQVRAHRLSS